MKNIIFALVGPSGCGKSKLILAAVSELQSKLEIIKSVTTRHKREEEDDLFYFFISEERFRLKINDDDFIEVDSYAGNLYGHDRRVVNAVLAKKYGICAITEQGVLGFEKAGYEVVPIRIIPRPDTNKIKKIMASINKSEFEKRVEADLRRAIVPVKYWAEIINSFAPGGKEKATEELINYIKSFVR